MDKIIEKNEAFVQSIGKTNLAEPADGQIFKKPKIDIKERRAGFDIGREVGVFDGFSITRRVSTVAAIAKLHEIRESKKYVEAGFHCWENFCTEALGCSKRSVDEQIEYFRKFGPEFLEAAKVISLSRKVFRDLKALPAAELEDFIKGSSVNIDGEEIPLDEDHADEINIAIASLIGKHKKMAEEADQKAATESAEVRKLKLDVTNRDATIKRMKEAATPELIEQKQQEIINITSEAVTRIGLLSTAASQIEDLEMKGNLYAFAIYNLDRAVTSLHQAVTESFPLPADVEIIKG